MTYQPEHRKCQPGVVIDMTAQSTFEIAPPTGGVRSNQVRGLRINFWDVNQNGSSQGFTLRFRAPNLVVSGYDSVSVERLTGGGTGTITTSTIQHNVQGIGGLGLSRGWWETWILDETNWDAFTWGQFYDDQDDSRIDHWGHIQLGGITGITGARIQSAPASNYTSGFFSYQWLYSGGPI